MTDTTFLELPNIHIPTDEIQAFCQRNHIRLLALFGSVIRSDFSVNSDIDVLVEFELGHVPGFSFFALQEELAQILGRTVDLNTPGFLSPHMRAGILSEAITLYDKT